MAEFRNIKKREVIDEIINKYGFYESYTDRELLGKQVKKICLAEPVTQNGVTTNLWEYSNVGKNKEHLFTRAEMEKIVTHYELCKYLLGWKQKDKAPKDKDKTEKTLHSIIDMHDRVENRIKSETEALRELNEPVKKNIISHYINETEQAYRLKETSNEIETIYTIEEVKKKKLEIMIEALYSRFFDPIDEELLHGDMETRAIMSGTNYSDVQFEESLMRLENPVEAYCVPKKESTNKK